MAAAPVRRVNWAFVRRGLVVGLLGALAMLAVVVSALPSLYVAVILWTGCQGDRAGLSVVGYPEEPISFPSRRGPTLRGSFSKGGKFPEFAIIVLPGHAGNTAFAISDAAIVAEAGYSVLLFEHRSCADPSLVASTGYMESFDVLGAVDFLKTRPNVTRIGAIGFSENGTATLLAAAQEPALEAIIAKGGYVSLRDDIFDPEEQLGWLDLSARQLVLAEFERQAGFDVDLSAPIDHIAEISPRPLFLIYGEFERRTGERLHEAAQEPKSLWIVPGAGHGDYFDRQPEEYPRRIVAFFDAAFAINR